MMSTVLLYGFSVARGMMRSKIGKMYFCDWKKEKSARMLDTWGNPIVGLYVLLVMVASLLTKEISWRGIRYQIADGGDIRLVGRDVDRSIWPLAGEEKIALRVNKRRSA